MKQRQTTWLLVTCLAAALLLCLWSGMRLTSAQGQAALSAEDLAVCRQLSQRLVLLKAGGLDPSVVEQHAPELIRAVKEASTVVGWPADGLSLRPGQAEMAGKPERLLVCVPVHLEGVQLQALVAFLHRLLQNGARVEVRELVVQPSGGTAAAWNADVTVAYAVPEAAAPEGR
jgi:hypothetical protein